MGVLAQNKIVTEWREQSKSMTATEQTTSIMLNCLLLYIPQYKKRDKEKCDSNLNQLLLETAAIMVFQCAEAVTSQYNSVNLLPSSILQMLIKLQSIPCERQIMKILTLDVPSLFLVH